jgi:hypothetical protein
VDDTSALPARSLDGHTLVFACARAEVMVDRTLTR